MAMTPIRSRTPRARMSSTFVLAVLLVLVALAARPTDARALTVAPNYRSTPLAYSTGALVQSCRSWSADADDAGRFYAGCPVMRDVDGNGTGDVGTPALFELDPSGRVTRIGYLPSEYYFNDSYRIRDVAVSPDGNTAYVSVGPIFDNLGQRPEIDPDTMQPLPNGAVRGTILRLRRQASGAWAYDPSWKAGPFKLGTDYWAARYLDVDASGRVYVGANAYVFELSPTTGQVVSAFGGGATTSWPGGPWVDGLDVVEGIAASPDGSTLYVVEEKFHIVQRWNRVGTTGWQRDTSFLLGKPGEEDDDQGSKGYCTTAPDTNQRFQAPYDVAVDAAGDIYVMDVTCVRVQRFTKAGTFVQTVWSDLGGWDLVHGFAVNWQGSVLLPEVERVLVRTDPPSRPVVGGGPPAACVDQAAPKVLGVSVPAASTTRGITVTVRTSDDCGVVSTRVSGAVLGTPLWKSGTKVTAVLGGWNGSKRIVVQVRDSAGRTASRRVTAHLALRQPPLRARTRVSIAGSGCATGNPLARVARASTYVLADRCARIAGRIRTVRRSGGSWLLQVRVSTTVARRIYTNAVGPVDVWVVTDSRTRLTRSPRRGRPAIVTSSIIATRTRRAAYAMPADRIIVR